MFTKPNLKPFVLGLILATLCVLSFQPVLSLADKWGRNPGIYDVSELVASSPHFTVCTPSNTVDLPETTRAIWVGVAGDVKVDSAEGDTAVVIPNVSAGMMHSFRVKRVYATGTTATSILVIY